jgi:hypothetical protein
MEKGKKVKVLLPGGFKPPHAGHLQLANAYAKEGEVIVLVGPKERDGIGADKSTAIWKMLPIEKNVKIMAVDAENPMVAAFDHILNMDNNATGEYAMAASSKGNDAKRSDMFIDSINAYKTKPTKDGRLAPKGITPIKLPIDVSPLLYKGRGDEYDGTGISASVLRKDLAAGDKEKFATNYPGVEKSVIDKIFSTLVGDESDMKENKKKKHIADVIEEMAIFRTIIRKLLTEGGAAGHMAHPFDIPSVKTGDDLIKVFEESANYLKTNEAPVKIDGINASIRLADIDGKRQFTLDRGSSKPLDVKGVTSDDLLDRFGEGHGMLKIGKNVLDIFNSSISATKSELKKLGLIDNPNILFNIEYVEGQSNVQKYDNNFLVIHNLLEIKQATPKRRETSEINYSTDDLEAYIKKLKPFANKAGFEILHKIPAKIKTSPNFSSELNKTYSVITEGGKKVTKSLKAWLSSAKNTKGEKLKLKDGKTVDALSKQVFLAVKNGTPISDIVANPADSQLAIDSFVIYQATMVLGDAILSAMTSPIGDVNEQEGIVVRNPEIYEKPYKITGSFIVRGMGSSFQK